MPKTRLVAPWSDKDGNPHAAGAEVEMSDEEFQAARANGVAMAEKQPYEGQEGHYGDVTSRTDVQGTPTAGTPVNAPSEDDDEEDEPVRRSVRKR